MGLVSAVRLVLALPKKKFFRGLLPFMFTSVRRRQLIHDVWQGFGRRNWGSTLLSHKATVVKCISMRAFWHALRPLLMPEAGGQIISKTPHAGTKC